MLDCWEKTRGKDHGLIRPNQTTLVSKCDTSQLGIALKLRRNQPPSHRNAHKAYECWHVIKRVKWASSNAVVVVGCSPFTWGQTVFRLRDEC